MILGILDKHNLWEGGVDLGQAVGILAFLDFFMRVDTAGLRQVKVAKKLAHLLGVYPIIAWVGRHFAALELGVSRSNA